MRLSLTTALRMDQGSLHSEASSLQNGLELGTAKMQKGRKRSAGVINSSAACSVSVDGDGSVGSASCTEMNDHSSGSLSEASCAAVILDLTSKKQNWTSESASERSNYDATRSKGQPDTTKIVSSTTKKQNPGERLQRSRERNRIHARKTRQRKKEQMQTLQNRADELKEEQIRLKQAINEKNTASILVGLFSRDSPSEARIEDPKVEELLRRPADEIPDASKLPELPALILPGQHNSKKLQAPDLDLSTPPDKQDLPDDGIDYTLLGKDRSTCSPAELDQIRRERNRMHAKRTRDRKRLFMEEMSDMCKTLEAENVLLERHLQGLNGSRTSPHPLQQPHHSVVSPTLSSVPAGAAPPSISSSECEKPPSSSQSHTSSAPVSEHGVTLDQIKCLLDAAGQFSSKSTSAVSASEGGSLSDQDHDFHSPRKRRRVNDSDDESSVALNPIAPSSATTVGC